MRIPLLHADFEHGSYTKIAKALRKVWPLGGLSLMQSQDSLGVLFGYSGQLDARRHATEAFSHQAGTIGMADVENTVVRRLFLRYGVDPLTGRDLIPRLHLSELAICADSRTDERLSGILRAIEGGLAMATGLGQGSTKAMANLLGPFDEAGYLLHHMSAGDQFKERLREISGIPNASYEVRGERVFVFEKLLRNVQALRMAADDVDLPDIALRLVDGATVAPLEAVDRWKIMPVPYEIEERRRGVVTIRHRPFNARIPGVFNDRVDAQPALVQLLMGEVVPGAGEFNYEGQPMTLCDPLSVDAFTMAPPVQLPGAAAERPWVGNWVEPAVPNWLDGFPPLPEERFIELSHACRAWDAACDVMDQRVVTEARTIWARAGELGLSALNDPDDVVDDGHGEKIKGLRECYPELSMLTDGSLYWQYYMYMPGDADFWDLRRTNDFIAYLAGSLIDDSLDEEGTTSLGKWFLYQLLSGSPVAEAKRFALEVESNRRTANRISRRMSEAMRFLRGVTQGPLRGAKVSTLADLYRLGRKKNSVPVMVEQCLPGVPGTAGRGAQTAVMQRNARRKIHMK
ncbi:hypothetical protein [Paraburkholderia youngii]|uniref:hypothetical protein n=1 Tax=Paraburkholderia youngii TaxID=2782701 RepID=UPI003D233BA3